MSQMTKITDLPQANTLNGLVTLGVNSANQSVKVPIELLRGNKVILETSFNPETGKLTINQTYQTP